MTDATIVLVLRHCYCACENMPNTRPWVGQTICQTFTCTPLQGLVLAWRAHTRNARHAPPALANGALRIAEGTAATPHSRRGTARQRHTGGARRHAHTRSRAPPRAGPTSPLTTPTKHNRLDGTDRSQRPQAQRAWTERTANNAHIKHNRFGRNGSHPRGPRRPPARESQTAMTPPQPPHL